MLRLFLRLYLLLALGFAAAIFVVDHVIDAFYDSIVENYHRDAVRGQAYSLVEKLAPLDQAGRQRQLEDWRPHYGLELSLTDARQAKLTQEEQALLDKNLLVVREDFTEFISRIDAGPQLLDIKLPPEPSLTPLFTVLAYILLGVLVGIAPAGMGPPALARPRDPAPGRATLRRRRPVIAHAHFPTLRHPHPGPALQPDGRPHRKPDQQPA
ncbi:putative two-component sensor [Pseudomonas aeruginosa]|nr:putative two-component sensor [Pseudomonas aeruginosa]